MTNPRPLLNQNLKSVRKIKPFYQQKWFYYFLGIMAFLSVASFVLRVITTNKLSQTQPDQAAWQGIQPGQVVEDSLLEKIQTPLINQKTTPSGKIFQFESPYPLYPNQIIVDQNNRVIAIEEQLPPESIETVDQLEQQYKSADLVLPLKENAFLKAYIFLEQGVMLIANPTNKIIERRWYFEPTDEETFFNNWNHMFSNQGSGPEQLVP